MLEKSREEYSIWLCSISPEAFHQGKELIKYAVQEDEFSNMKFVDIILNYQYLNNGENGQEHLIYLGIFYMAT